MFPSFVSSVGQHKTVLCAFTLSVAALGVAPVAHAQTIIPAANRITANDGAASDAFGISVALSGNNALVGATFADIDGRSNQGAAYLFNATNGAQTLKLTANDGTASDNFGNAVAISGNIALVGASGDTVNGNSGQGSAYLFNATNGTQIAKLTASDGAVEDIFGNSVAISGNIALVGARLAEGPNNRQNQGAAYLFNATTGVQTFKLVASDSGILDEFGSSVAISGNTALVGARNDDILGKIFQGSAYLFDATDGTQIRKLTASDGFDNDRFGTSVAISGNFALVGARDADINGISNQGAAYLFDITSGVQLFKFTASDGAANDSFGFSVALSGNTALVGARSTIDGKLAQGSVYAFNVLTGLQIDRFSSADGDASDGFGNSLALDGNNALIGASGDDITVGGITTVNQGSAYRFTVVPEPGGVALLLPTVLGLVGLVVRRKGCVGR